MSEQLVDASGRPLRRQPNDGRCPRCGKGKEKRVPSAGFGTPHPVCSNCGHEFVGEEVTE